MANIPTKATWAAVACVLLLNASALALGANPGASNGQSPDASSSPQPSEDVQSLLGCYPAASLNDLTLHVDRQHAVQFNMHNSTTTSGNGKSGGPHPIKVHVGQMKAKQVCIDAVQSDSSNDLIVTAKGTTLRDGTVTTPQTKYSFDRATAKSITMWVPYPQAHQLLSDLGVNKTADNVTSPNGSTGGGSPAPSPSNVTNQTKTSTAVANATSTVSTSQPVSTTVPTSAPSTTTTSAPSTSTVPTSAPSTTTVPTSAPSTTTVPTSAPSTTTVTQPVTNATTSLNTTVTTVDTTTTTVQTTSVTSTTVDTSTVTNAVNDTSTTSTSTSSVNDTLNSTGGTVNDTVNSTGSTLNNTTNITTTTTTTLL